ncbi:MAG: hypothetical protein ACYDBJ_11035 [Aggregatilineales bacterium]
MFAKQRLSETTRGRLGLTIPEAGWGGWRGHGQKRADRASQEGEFGKALAGLVAWTNGG